MTAAGEIAASLRGALSGAVAQAAPFRHWLLRDVLAPAVLAAVRGLPVALPRIVDTQGRRETNNATRSYFSAEARSRWPVAQAMAAAFQARPTVDLIEERCAARLAGSFLRIEYCQDTDGFWLEPHTDIQAKLLTFIVYLSQPTGREEWGTDLYNPDLSPAGHAPCAPGRGLVFVPAGDTWHGFRRRRITGVRRSLIVNYVKPEWRARHELAFPEAPLEK